MRRLSSMYSTVQGPGARRAPQRSLCILRRLARFVVSVELEHLVDSLAHGGDLVRNIKNLGHVLIDLIKLRFYFLNIGLDLIEAFFDRVQLSFDRTQPALVL